LADRAETLRLGGSQWAVGSALTNSTRNGCVMVPWCSCARSSLNAYRSGAPPMQVSFAEFARQVERFAGALYELGVRPGDVVALQLPNFWQAGGLMLGAARLGEVKGAPRVCARATP
jgi:acyl-coenzyme A synthetase/AMP-(fatty) acid ligase